MSPCRDVELVFRTVRQEAAAGKSPVSLLLSSPLEGKEFLINTVIIRPIGVLLTLSNTKWLTSEGSISAATKTVEYHHPAYAIMYGVAGRDQICFPWQNVFFSWTP